MERLNFIDHQRIFLLVGRVLHTLTQLIEFAEMLFPEFIDGDKEDSFVPFLDDRLATGAVSLFEIHHKVEETFAVRHRYSDTTLESAVLDTVDDHRLSHLDDALALAVEGSLCGSVDLLYRILL